MKKILLGVAVLATVGLGWFAWPTNGTGSLGDAIVAAADGARPELKDVGEGSDAQSSRRVVVTAVGSDDVPNTPPKPATGSVELLVQYRADKHPAAGVRVMVMRRALAWGDFVLVETDASGRVLLADLAPGALFLRAVQGGDTEVTVVAGITTRASLTIPNGVGVSVHVADAHGSPVAGARVWLSERWRNNRGAIVGRTDRSGVLRLRHVSPECYLAARCRGFAPSRLYSIPRAIGGDVRIDVVVQRGGGSVAGLVVDHAGAPVTGAQVLIGSERPKHAGRASDGRWLTGPPPIFRVTDESGRFEADVAELGVLPLQVRHPEFAPYACEIESRPGSPVGFIVLEPGAVLHGRVTRPGGAPVIHAKLTIDEPDSFRGQTKLSDGQGRYVVEGLAAGEHDVQVASATSRLDEKLRIGPGQRLEWNPVLLDGPRGQKRLEGRVVDDRGQPLPSWRVVARSKETNSTTKSTSTDSKGRFRLAVPWDSMRVWTHGPGKHAGFPAVIRDDVRVDDGELILRVRDASFRCGEIVGVVVDPAGRPVEAQIEAWHADHKVWRSFDNRPKSGAFHIEDVPPGKIELRICPSDFAWQQLPAVMLDVGQELDLGRIEVRPGGRVAGRLVLGAGPPTNVAIKLLQPGGDEAAVVEYTNGRYRSGVLATGDYVLRVLADRYAMVEKNVHIVSGEVHELDIRLQPAVLRRLEFELDRGFERPRFLKITIQRSSDQQLVWAGGFRAAGELALDVSVPPGSYVLRAHGPGRTTWLETPLEVASLADKDSVIRYKVCPVRRR